jgi:hypothetical protein
MSVRDRPTYPLLHDFFTAAPPLYKHSVVTENGFWFGLLMVLLINVLLALRTNFPQASQRSETTALIITTVLFVSLCCFLLPR